MTQFRLGDMGNSTESYPGPTMCVSQVICAFIRNLYPHGLLLLLLFLLLMYSDSSGYYVKETSTLSGELLF